MMASVAGRYASALFDIAKEARLVAAIEADLNGFEKTLGGSADLQRLVRSPVFSGDDQAKALGAILAKSSAQPLTQNFLKLLARNRRLFAVGDMIKAFRQLSARDRNVIPAEVVSAHPLSAEQLAALKATLKDIERRDVDLQTKVDPALLGGLVVKVGSRMIDSSLRTKLNAMKIAMKGLA